MTEQTKSTPTDTPAHPDGVREYVPGHEPQETAPAEDTPPTWAKDLLTNIEKSQRALLSKLGNLQSRLPDPTPSANQSTDSAPSARESTSSQASAKASPGLTPADLAAAMELGQLSAGLPEPASEMVNGLVKSGDFQRAAEVARLSRSIMDSIASQPNEKSTKRRAPQPHGVVPGDAGGVQMPRTKLEYRQMATDNPKAFAALNADPSFDPASLPSGYRRR